MSGLRVLTQCKICSSKHRREIENMLVTEGRSYNYIIKAMEKEGFIINLSNLSCHKNKHMMNDVNSLIALSKSAASLDPEINAKDLSSEDLLDYVIQEGINGIAELKKLPVSHYTLNARNNFMSTIRQIAEGRLKASGVGDKEDITEMINKQLKERGLIVDVTKKE